MRNLLNKEWKLCIGVQIWIYFAVGVLVNMAPNYPHYMSTFFICIGIFMMFQQGVMNKDVLFTVCLPVKKSDVVKARVAMIGVIEFMQVLLSIPMIFVAQKIGMENDAGIEMNVAFLGFSFVLFTVFNISFISIYYKKADKANVAFLVSSFAFMFPAMAIIEIPTFIKNKDTAIGLIGSFIDSAHPEDMVAQIPIAVGGLIVWLLGLLLCHFIGSRKFERVDL